MRVAVLIPAAGSPGTLATTAFIGALMDGFAATGVDARVFGLTLDVDEWHPEALGTRETSAPWLPPTPYRLGDRTEAHRRGIFDQDTCTQGVCEPRWRLELQLERALLEFAPRESECVLLVDSRSYLLLRLSCRIAGRLGWKIVVVSNEALLDHLIDPATRDDYIRCVVGCASGVWSFSNHLAEYWTSLGVPAERVFVSPPPVRASSFAPGADSPQSACATYIGNLAHREVAHLLDIADLVVAEEPAFKLSIHGDASDDVRKSLQQTTADRGLGTVVSVNPAVLPVEVPRILSGGGVLLLPRSAGEFSAAGFPNKLGEYLASGRPVIATRVGDIPRYLTDGESAYLVDPDDNQAFAATVVRVLQDPAEATDVGEGGRRVADQLLRSDAVARRVVEFLRALSPAQACALGGPGRPLWRRLGALKPDRELTRRDVAWALRGVRRQRKR